MSPDHYARLLRDPNDDVMSLGASGIAVSNVRSALRMLGYQVTPGKGYDEPLAACVRAFQTDVRHSNIDGVVGPGTRVLLSKSLFKEFGDAAIGYLKDPSTKRAVHDEHFLRLVSMFEDGSDGKLLAVGQSGQAVQNIRRGLNLLGYPIADGSYFDDEVRLAVLKLQSDYGHVNCDGCVGPGTRQLLAAKLNESFGPSIINRFEDNISPPEPHIFLSYRRGDLQRFSECLGWIAGWGHSIWYDQQIPGSADWYAELEERLSRCILVLVFLSQSAVDSKWVQREIFFGDSLNKPILPIRVEPVQLHSGLNFVLSRYQYLDLSHPGFKEQLQKAISFAVSK